MKIEYQGLVYSMRKLAKKFNINHNTLYGRLKRGWSIEKALETKVREMKNYNKENQ